MSKQTVNIGTVANDGTGDTLRDAFDKLNDNFDETYGWIRAAGGVAVVSGEQTITFSSPLPSASYSLNIWDYTGSVVVELVSQDANGFTIDCVNAGAINYQAILNQ